MDFLLPYLNIIYTGLGVLAFVLLIMIGARLLGGRVRGRKGSRLGISEYYEIDKSRRLVLIRRDEVEHLLLIGGDHDIVVESEIGSPLISPQVAPSPRPPPRPAVFGGRRPVLRPVEGTGDMRHQREEPEM